MAALLHKSPLLSSCILFVALLCSSALEMHSSPLPGVPKPPQHFATPVSGKVAQQPPAAAAADFADFGGGGGSSSNLPVPNPLDTLIAAVCKVYETTSTSSSPSHGESDQKSCVDALVGRLALPDVLSTRQVPLAGAAALLDDAQYVRDLVQLAQLDAVQPESVLRVVVAHVEALLVAPLPLVAQLKGVLALNDVQPALVLGVLQSAALSDAQKAAVLTKNRLVKSATVNEALFEQALLLASAGAAQGSLPGGMPSVPGLNNLPGGVPSVPGLNNLPGGMPSVPGMNNLPGGMPSVPGMNGLPFSVPNAQALNGLQSTVPTVPGLNNLPGGVPTVPSLNGLPISASNVGGVPNFGSPLGGVPSVTGLSAAGLPTSNNAANVDTIRKMIEFDQYRRMLGA